MTSHRFARSRRTQVQDGNVKMTADVGTRLRHASDTPGDLGVVFGGDTMGHWNVDRVNRMLDAFDAPVRQLALPLDRMLGLGRVGDPDPDRAARYATLDPATMPPRSFVSMLEAPPSATLRTLLVDGHHRMLALYLLGATSVPARILPPILADDVRVVEMGQTVTFPEPTFAGRRIDLGPAR